MWKTKAARALMAAAMLAAGTPAVAAEKGRPPPVPGSLRKHIQVVEGQSTASGPCDTLPTRGEIARVVHDTLVRDRAQFKMTKVIDIAGPKVPLDADALKVTVNVRVEVGPVTPIGNRLAQTVETNLAFWWTADPVASLPGVIRTASAQRVCDAELAKSILAGAADMAQGFARDVAEQQRGASVK